MGESIRFYSRVVIFSLYENGKYNLKSDGSLKVCLALPGFLLSIAVFLLRPIAAHTLPALSIQSEFLKL